MSTQTLVPTTATRTSLLWVLTGLADAIVVIVVGNIFVDHGAQQSGGTLVAVGSAALCLGVAVAATRLLRPGHAGSDRTAVVLAVVTVLSLPVFWSGLPCVLGGVTVAARTRRGSLGVPGWIGLVAMGLVLAWTLVGLTR